MRKFITKHGSTVTISGKYLGIIEIDFDWFEEVACIEAHPTFNQDFNDPMIVVECECCGVEEYKLSEITELDIPDETK